MRLSFFVPTLALAVMTASCNTPSEPDVFLGEAEVFTANGIDKLSNVPVDSYTAFFKVGSAEIVRTLDDDLDALLEGLNTDSAGQFSTSSDNLKLSRTFYTDRQVCNDVCTSYGESCYDYDDYSCDEVCDSYTDEDGNTYYDCYESCSGGTSTYCDSYCESYTTDCYWVTDANTVSYNYDDVEAVRTEIQITALDGTAYITAGTPRESRQDETCSTVPGDDQQVEICTPINTWLQSDRFQTPFVSSSEGIAVSPHVRGLTKQNVKRIGVNEQNELTEEQMEKIRSVRRALGVSDDQVAGRR